MSQARKLAKPYGAAFNTSSKRLSAIWMRTTSSRQLPFHWLYCHPENVLPLIVFVASIALSCRRAITSLLNGSLLPTNWWHIADPTYLYQAGTLGVNYFQFGFVRRGLGGTIAYLLHPNLLVATVLFSVIFAICMAALACWILARFNAVLPLGLPFAIIFIDIMIFWGLDAGRTDIAIAFLLSLGAVALVRGRVITACLCMAIGLAMHENSFIFGIPLLGALLLEQGRYRQLSLRTLAGAAALIAGTLLLYVSLDSLPHADATKIVRTIRASLPLNEYVDWAVFFAVSGVRGVRGSICQNAVDPNHVLHAVGACVLILLTIFALAGRRRSVWILALLASLLPFFFLWTVANDMSRWVTLSMFVVWLICAFRRIDPGEEVDRLAWLRVACAVLILPLHNPGTVYVPYPIYSPSPFIENVVRKLGGPETINVVTAFERCDPTWRSVLGDYVPPSLNP